MSAPVPLHPLPDLWVHRTPTRAYMGPLEFEPPAAGAEAMPETDALVRPQREPLFSAIGRGLRSALRGTRGSDGTHGAGWVHVLAVLTRTDFRARYRGQALGIVWSILYPLVMMGIMSLVFTQVFRSTNKHFPIFLLIGLIFWQWVTSSLGNATQVFVSHADIIKRTVFHRQLLPISMVLSYGVNFCIESMTLLLFIPIFPDAFRFSPALLVIPVLLGALVLLLAGITLITSVLNVIYRDVAYIVNTGLLLLYWLTPVIYPIEVIPYPYRIVIQGSPLSGILLALRHAVMDGQVPTLLGWAGIILPTILLFAIGWLLFRHYERMVLDYV